MKISPAFEQLKRLCAKVAKSRPDAAQCAVVAQITQAVFEWDTENERERDEFVTDPHGAQTLFLCELNEAKDHAITERLFRLTGDHGRAGTGQPVQAMAGLPQ